MLDFFIPVTLSQCVCPDARMRARTARPRELEARSFEGWPKASVAGFLRHMCNINNVMLPPLPSSSPLPSPTSPPPPSP